MKNQKETKPRQEYIPFGEEWRKEMKKLPKDFIIDLLRKQLLKQ
jgi:hypothetical protein